MEGSSEFFMLMYILSEEDILCNVSQICLNKEPTLILRVCGRARRIPYFGKACPRTSLQSLN